MNSGWRFQNNLKRVNDIKMFKAREAKEGSITNDSNNSFVNNTQFPIFQNANNSKVEVSQNFRQQYIPRNKNIQKPSSQVIQILQKDYNEIVKTMKTNNELPKMQNPANAQKNPNTFQIPYNLLFPSQGIRQELPSSKEKINPIINKSHKTLDLNQGTNQQMSQRMNQNIQKPSIPNNQKPIEFLPLFKTPPTNPFQNEGVKNSSGHPNQGLLNIQSSIFSKSNQNAFPIGMQQPPNQTNQQQLIQAQQETMMLQKQFQLERQMALQHQLYQQPALCQPQGFVNSWTQNQPIQNQNINPQFMQNQAIFQSEISQQHMQMQGQPQIQCLVQAQQFPAQMQGIPNGQAFNVQSYGQNSFNYNNTNHQSQECMPQPTQLMMIQQHQTPASMSIDQTIVNLQKQLWCALTAKAVEQLQSHQAHLVSTILPEIHFSRDPLLNLVKTSSFLERSIDSRFDSKAQIKDSQKMLEQYKRKRIQISPNKFEVEKTPKKICQAVIVFEDGDQQSHRRRFMSEKFGQRKTNKKHRNQQDRKQYLFSQVKQPSTYNCTCHIAVLTSISPPFNFDIVFEMEPPIQKQSLGKRIFEQIRLQYLQTRFLQTVLKSIVQVDKFHISLAKVEANCHLIEQLVLLPNYKCIYSARRGSWIRDLRISNDNGWIGWPGTVNVENVDFLSGPILEENGLGISPELRQTLGKFIVTLKLTNIHQRFMEDNGQLDQEKIAKALKKKCQKQGMKFLKLCLGKMEWTFQPQ